MVINFHNYFIDIYISIDVNIKFLPLNGTSNVNIYEVINQQSITFNFN